jgi:hypothetical protein
MSPGAAGWASASLGLTVGHAEDAFRANAGDSALWRDPQAIQRPTPPPRSTGARRGPGHAGAGDHVEWQLDLERRADARAGALDARWKTLGSLDGIVGRETGCIGYSIAAAGSPPDGALTSFTKTSLSSLGR